MEWSDTPNINSNQMSQSPDWIQYVLNQPMVEKPGRVWNYNSGGSQLLAVILQKTTGLTAADYAQSKIFKPLGITEFRWWSNPQGYSTAGWGLHLASYDIAKIGYLWLRKGYWGNQQVIPRNWIREATTRHFSVESGIGRGSGYGYQWWVYTNLPWHAYKAWGSFGKHTVMIIIIPKQDLVVVLAGNNSKDQRLLKEFILPAIKSPHPIPANPATVMELNHLLQP